MKKIIVVLLIVCMCFVSFGVTNVSAKGTYKNDLSNTVLVLETNSSDSIITKILNWIIDLISRVLGPIIIKPPSSNCPTGLTEATYGGVKYCVVSNYKIPETMKKQKDYKCDNHCNCYASAYYRSISDGKKVSDQYYGYCNGCSAGKGTCNNGKCTSGTAYTCNTNQCKESGTSSGTLAGAFTAIINGKPGAIAHVRRSSKTSGGHYIVFVGIKQDTYAAYKNNKSPQISMSDFYAVDPYDANYYNAGGKIPYYNNETWKYLGVSY